MSNHPYMVSKARNRDFQTAFTGYNHNLVTGDTEFFDMKNLTGDYAPVMSPRNRRGILKRDIRKPQGLLVKEHLAWVDDDALWYAGEKVADLHNNKGYDERQLVSMGAKIVVFPDKYYYNTKDESDNGYLEKTFEAKGGEVTFTISTMNGDDIEIADLGEMEEEPENGTYILDTSGETAVLKVYSEAQKEWSSVATTYIKITYPSLGKDFSADNNDAIGISGVKDYPELNGTFPIWAKGDDYIVVTGILKEGIYKQNTDEDLIIFKRAVPDLDFVVESENRLWGCKWGYNAEGEFENTIYACAQGDPTNWYRYLGTSMDSYALSVGSDGQFTGAAVHGGYVMFFKENVIHKVYGSKPSNYQITNVTGRGILRDSAKSACIVNETLYYLSKSGICKYGGGVPGGIYSPFGTERYHNATGGRMGDKYYVSMQDIKDKHHLFCFDEGLQMWFKEDGLNALFFAEDKGNLFYFDGTPNEDGKYNLCVMDAEHYDGTMFRDELRKEKSFEWWGETGDIGMETPDCKWYSDIQIRVMMNTGAVLRVFVQYNSDGEWIQIAELRDKPKGAYTIPIHTQKVDHLKLKIGGEGDVKIYSISKYYEPGSEMR